MGRSGRAFLQRWPEPERGAAGEPRGGRRKRRGQRSRAQGLEGQMRLGVGAAGRSRAVKREHAAPGRAPRLETQLATAGRAGRMRLCANPHPRRGAARRRGR